MKTTYLLNPEFQPSIKAYQRALKEIGQADELSKTVNGTVAELEKMGIAAGSPPLSSGSDGPKEQFQHAGVEVSRLLGEVARESAMKRTLENQIQAAEQSLAAAKKLEKARRIKTIVFVVIGILFLLFILSQCKG
jgi:hypothetical protein